MPTKVNRDVLNEWKQQLPKRLHIFMDNFFLTCEPYSPEFNLVNYRRDIQLYGATTPAYRENRDKLVQAFYEITGWVPGKKYEVD